MDLVQKLNTLNISEKLNFRLIDHILIGSIHSISVQASEYHYCKPRKTIPLDQYTHFEVMLKIPHDDVPNSWSEYGDIDNIYAYVPKHEIELLLTTLDKKYKIL